MAREAPSELPLTPWAQDADTLLAALASGREGLASAEAQRRLQATGRNEIGRSSRAGAFATRLDGSYSGVMGLPLFETADLLAKAGLAVL